MIKRLIIIIIYVLVYGNCFSQKGESDSHISQLELFQNRIINNNTLKFTSIYNIDDAKVSIIKDTLICNKDTCLQIVDFNINSNKFTYVVKKDTIGDLWTTKVYDTYFRVNDIIFKDTDLTEVGQSIYDISIAKIDSNLIVLISTFFYNSCCGNSANNYFLFTICGNKINYNFLKQYPFKEYYEICNINNDSFVDLVKYSNFESTSRISNVYFEKITVKTLFYDNVLHDLCDLNKKKYYILLKINNKNDKFRIVNYNWMYKLE